MGAFWSTNLSAVTNLICWEMVVKNATLLTKNISADRVTSLCAFNKSGGRRIRSDTTGAGLLLVVLPIMNPKSFPKMISAFLISSTVTLVFGIILFVITPM